MSSNEDWTYEQLKKRIDGSITKEEARQHQIDKKRAERRAIKKGGGGVAIARKIMATVSHDTDFDYGNNLPTQSDDVQQQSADEVHRCMGRVTCATCKKFHGYCIEVQEEKEKIKMLPTGEGTPRNNNNRSGGMNFINVADLTTTGQEAKILMVRYNEKGKWGPSVTLKVSFKGEMRYLNVKPDKKADPRYRLMLENFGPDENNWINQRILLSAELDEFTESARMKVDIAQPAKKGK